MGIVVKVVVGIVILVVASTVMHYLNRNLGNGSMYFIAFIFSLFLFPFIAVKFCYPAFGLWLLGALIAKFLSNEETRTIDQSSFQRQYGGIAARISQILWVAALMYIIYDIVALVF